MAVLELRKVSSRAIGGSLWGAGGSMESYTVTVRVADVSLTVRQWVCVVLIGRSVVGVVMMVCSIWFCRLWLRVAVVYLSV